MGTKSKASKKTQLSKTNDGDLIWVDPARIRFQHARIRPVFSSCGRSLTETLDSIRAGEITPLDLPPIQVLVGPETDCGPWYFSLNNRRLWVLKRCREEGLLVDHRIRVRVRAPKSKAEADRYTLEKCVLEAKVMREGGNSKKETSSEELVPQLAKDDDPGNEWQKQLDGEPDCGAIVKSMIQINSGTGEVDDDNDSDSTSDVVRSNRFSVLF